MITRTLLLLTCFYLLSATNTASAQSENLKGTKWGYNQMSDIWCDVYHFITDSTLTFYSCEMDETLRGIYYFNADTLIIEEFADYPEGYTPKPNTCEMPEKIMYKFFIKGNKMHPLKRYNWGTDNYILTEEEFGSNFYYKRFE